MDLESIVKEASDRISRYQDVPLSHAAEPPAGWEVDRPSARRELKERITEVTYRGRTKEGKDLTVIADKGKELWIARAGGVEMEARLTDFKDADEVAKVLDFAQRQMDREIKQEKEEPGLPPGRIKERPEAPRIPAVAPSGMPAAAAPCMGIIRKTAERILELP